VSIYFITMPKDKDVKYQHFKYPAGESQVRLLSSELPLIRKASRVVITSFINDADFIPVMLLTDALVRTNLDLEVTLLLPYLPYSRADRQFMDGDCLSLKLVTFFLSEVYSGGLVTFDVHSSKAKEFLPELVDVSPIKIISDVITRQSSRPTLILPDEGARSRYNYGDYDAKNPFTGGWYPISHCEKVRDPATGAISGFKVPVISTNAALIVDDLCDGGVTFVGIGKAIKATQPDVKLTLYVSHGIFSKGFDELKKYFDHIYTTNSFAGQRDPEFVTEIPVEGLMKARILTTSELFEQVSKS
jgi:ribose-phosphate pyrophosphokinase